MTKPEAWTESCLVNLNDGTTDMSIAAIATSVTINQGGKPVESVPNLSGGRILIFKPEEEHFCLSLCSKCHRAEHKIKS